jgi:hypothetical protein
LPVAVFRAVRADESLYTGSEGDRALKLFEDALARCTINPLDYGAADSDAIHFNVRTMDLIAIRIQEFFRIKMGIENGTPLHDVFRLDAYRLINLSLLGGKYKSSAIFSRDDDLAR